MIFFINCHKSNKLKMEKSVLRCDDILKNKAELVHEEENQLVEVFDSLLKIDNTGKISETKPIDKIKEKCISWFVSNILKKQTTYTKPGSISYLLYGEILSEHSINIKFGTFGQIFAEELIKTKDNLELLKCGVQSINKIKKKDIDLIFIDKDKKIVYYRELKGNISLDSEKLPATIDKCKEIESFLKEKYSTYSIDTGILNWSVFNRKILDNKIVTHIKQFEKNGIKVDHMEDFLNIIDVSWDEDDFKLYYREIGNKIKNSKSVV